MRQTIRARGARRLFLPPCAPDLDPIAQVVAKLQRPPRNAAERTDEATWRRIGSPPNACPAMDEPTNSPTQATRERHVIGPGDPL